MRSRRTSSIVASIMVLALLASCDLVSGLVGGGATLGVSPNTVDLGPVATGNSNAEVVSVENFTGSAVSVTASSDRPWLSVSDSSFSIPAGGTESLAIQGTCASSLEGTTATGTVTVSDGRTPIAVQVAITCLPPGDLAAVPSSAYLSGEAGETPSLEITLANTTGDAIDFTIVGVPGWLDVTPAAGTVPANGTVALALTSTAPCPSTRSVLGSSFDVDFASGTFVVEAFEICADAPANAYNVDIRFFGDGFDLDSITAFLDAAAKWEAVITDDVEDRSGLSTNAGDCSGPGFPNEPGLEDATVDDLLIYAGISAIDGEFGIVGSAGPCILRPNTAGAVDPLLPVYGTAFFDSADAQRLQIEGRLDAVILHEMGHVIGIGTIWDNFALIDFTGNGSDCVSSTDLSNASYTGVNGVAAYEDLTGDPENTVPVEEDGGPGTRCGHWDEEVFEDELMTGTLDNAGDPLSALTGESLLDLGYATDPNAYDPYALPLCSPTCLAAAGEDEEHGTEILLFPRYEIAPDGTLAPL